MIVDFKRQRFRLTPQFRKPGFPGVREFDIKQGKPAVIVLESTTVIAP